MNVRELLSKRPTAMQAVVLDPSGRHETIGESRVLEAAAIGRTRDAWTQIGDRLGLGAPVEIAISDGAEASLFMFATKGGRTLAVVDAPVIDDIDSRAAEVRAVIGEKP
jgi:hypothetical protein